MYCKLYGVGHLKIKFKIFLKLNGDDIWESGNENEIKFEFTQSGLY